MDIKSLIIAGWAIVVMPFTAADKESPTISVLQPQKGVYVTQITNPQEYSIRPYTSDKLISVKELYDTIPMDKNKKATSNNNILYKYKMVVNAGFFDPNNGKTASYVVENKKIILDPTKNEALMSNKTLIPYMDKILNRSEFRVLTCGNTKKYDIAYHNDLPERGCEIEHSIQAGPMLGYKMDLEKEFFIKKDENGKITRDSIGAMQKTARTAIGLKKDELYIFIATDKAPMTIEELNNFMFKYKLEKAMAFDGGSSTSLNCKSTEVFSGDTTGRKVKSFLVIDNTTERQVK